MKNNSCFEVIANTKDLSREEWLKIRRDYLGGSDAAAAIGLNPWRSSAQVFIEKRSDDELSDAPDNYAMKLGRMLEDTVARLFEETTGKKVRRNNQMMVSTTCPWMLADIDREIVGEDAILECKTTKGWNREQWADGAIPLMYQIQCNHYMAVTGAGKCYIACMIGFEDFVIREIERDEELIEMLVEAEREFVEKHLKTGELPLPDGTKAYTNTLSKLYPKAEPETVVELEECGYSMDYYWELDGMIKELKEKKERIVQDIKSNMKENEAAMIAGNRVTWKHSERSTFDPKKYQEAHPADPDGYKKYMTVTQSRRFTIRKIKEEE